MDREVFKKNLSEKLRESFMLNRAESPIAQDTAIEIEEGDVDLNKEAASTLNSPESLAAAIQKMSQDQFQVLFEKIPNEQLNILAKISKGEPVSPESDGDGDVSGLVGPAGDVASPGEPTAPAAPEPDISGDEEDLI